MSYNPPTDGELAPGKPIRSTLMTRLRDALLATLAGDPSAPAISPAALRWKFDDIAYGTTASGNFTGSNGSFTWTPPAGVTAVLVEAVGAGGGAGGGNGASGNGGNASAGGSCSFAGVTLANGGGGGGGSSNAAGGSAGAAGAVAAGADFSYAGQAGTAGTAVSSSSVPPEGASVPVSPCGHGVGGRYVAQTSTTPYVGRGQGGRGYGAGAGPNGGGNFHPGSGGSGSYGRKVFSVIPGTGYAVTVGIGGAGGTANGGTSAGQTGGTGLNGKDAASDGGTTATVQGGSSGASGLVRIWYTY